MTYRKDKEPELRDEVKHKNGDVTGIVITKFIEPLTKTVVLDVRGSDDKIYYDTPAENWEVVRENDE